MSNLTAFNFESHDIRFIEGKPVANDVAVVLGYADPQSTISKKVSPKNKGVAEMETPGGMQLVIVLKEAGIYQLIFSSKLETAEKFQDWVFSEVLPSIRKTGGYSVNSQKQLPSVTTSRLTDLKANDALVRHQIKVLESELTDKRRELQNIQQELFAEAKAVLDANPDLAKQVLDAKEIIERAKQANKYLSA
ncbi:BRO-N domain-containing protein [Nostoc sp.]|uniref:BRO-N domain-containing protein n=1 Tax=Nostoc sp. TaxID=1180 RepID=UPI002FF8E1FA